MENSLYAYEQAWALGFVYAECDITMTRDEELVLNHDDDHHRLAMFPHAKMMKEKVKDMKIREVKKVFNRAGGSAPFLSHVLDSARVLNGRLVIELKPGNARCAAKMVQLLKARPEY